MGPGKFVLLKQPSTMNDIETNLKAILNTIPPEVTLVAVSKTVGPEMIMDAYRAGQRVFGENKAQELQAKQKTLPGDICWHFIGHLQTNKVKHIAPFIHLVESMDRMKLLEELNSAGKKHGRVIRCLLQFHIATEESKFGLDQSEAEAILTSTVFQDMQYVQICGVMGMASFTDDRALIRSEFRKLKEIFQLLHDRYFTGKPEFREISMGMSGDYPIAIEEGSTMVRIGTALFGERHYSDTKN